MKKADFRILAIIPLLALILAMAMPAGAQKKIKVEKPDLAQIKSATLDPESEYYFPKLLKLYERNDTVMTPEQYRHFYLGYMFQEDYDPYRTSPYSGRTDYLRAKTVHSSAERDTIIKYAELALLDNPFDLRQMSFLVHVLKEKRKDMRAKIWEYRLQNILGAIKSTGTGENEENAWYVISPTHEYDMIQLLGYEATEAEFLEPGIDHLIVVPDEATRKKRRGKVADGFFFNVEIPTAEYARKHTGEFATDDADTGSGDTLPEETPRQTENSN